MSRTAPTYIIWFILYIPLMFFACNWIFNEICVSAGKDPFEVMNKRKEICGSSFTYSKMYVWLLSESPDQARTKRWIHFYQISTLSPSIGIMFSVISLFTHLFDKFLSVAVWFIMGYMFFIVILGIIYRLNKK